VRKVAFLNFLDEQGTIQGTGKIVIFVLDKSSAEYGGRRLEFGTPFRGVSMIEAFDEAFEVDSHFVCRRVRQSRQS